MLASSSRAGISIDTERGVDGGDDAAPRPSPTRGHASAFQSATQSSAQETIMTTAAA
jgi:hypothetical protein